MIDRKNFIRAIEIIKRRRQMGYSDFLRALNPVHIGVGSQRSRFSFPDLLEHTGNVNRSILDGFQGRRVMDV